MYLVPQHKSIDSIAAVLHYSLLFSKWARKILQQIVRLDLCVSIHASYMYNFLVFFKLKIEGI